ncbi:thioredoxin [Companilactobacillus sp. RD055328]|uniref:DsbA family oxidoreductase n=1 Tax=Companilactobacillus sp. RD055328 TaxID=2916634 RepID=UPI001FC83C27|nr:DsbA family protein [Companilactobacillus sp. RD055328]GKQ42469.1 thioredoxin [Companilactobacillus sp. RD055328]
MKIEFFHDVICSFCFPMSYRMHSIKEELPEVEIIHRSFALGWEPDAFVQMFGSREAVKPEVLNHWEHANRIDELHRFNIDGMKKEDFLFPTSKYGLIAAKAAGLVGGQDVYWEVFDKLQEGLFMRSMNVEDLAVIRTLVKETSIDFNAWEKQFEDSNTVEAVMSDFELAQKYGINSIPTLIVNGKYLINGAQRKDKIIETLKMIQQQEEQEKKLVSINNEGGTCNLKDGKWECD